MSEGDCSCPNEMVKQEPVTVKVEEKEDGEKTPEENPMSCPICHEKVRNPIGSPDCCDHVYCSRCIRKWAKNTNRCPLDRLKFDYIFIRNSPTSPRIVRRIPVRDCDLVVDNITFTAAEAAVMFHDANDYDHCQVCGQSTDPSVLLLCDSCGLGYHMYCLVPALNEIPEGDWFCPVCRPGLTDETGSQISLESTSTAVGAEGSPRRVRRTTLPSVLTTTATRRRRFQRGSGPRTRSTSQTEREQIRDIADQVERLLGIAGLGVEEEEAGPGESDGESVESGIRYSLPSISRRAPGVKRRRGRKVKRRRTRRRVFRRRSFRTLAARRVSLLSSHNRHRAPDSSAAAAAASRARLVARLGIVRIRSDNDMPVIKLPQPVIPPLRGGRVPISVGGPSGSWGLQQANELSIFGNDYQAPSCDEDDVIPMPEVMPVESHPIIRSPGDFLSGLMESQAFLHLPASKLHIAPDGRLQQEELAAASRLPRLPSTEGQPSSQPSGLRQSIVTCGVSGATTGSRGTTSTSNEPGGSGNHTGEMYDPFHPTSEDGSAMSMSPQDQGAGGGHEGASSGPVENGLASMVTKPPKMMVKSQQKSGKKAADMFKVTDSEPEEDLVIRDEKNSDGNGTKKRRHSPHEASENLKEPPPPGVSLTSDSSSSKKDDKSKHRHHESRSPSSSSSRRHHSSSKHHKHHRHHRDDDEKQSAPEKPASAHRPSNVGRRRSRSRSNSRTRGRPSGQTSSSRPWRASGIGSPARNRRSRSKSTRSRSRSRHRDRSKNSHDRDRDRDRRVQKSPSPRKSRPDTRRDASDQKSGRERGQNNHSTSSDRRKVNNERGKDDSLLQSPSGRRDPFAILTSEADAKVNAIRQQSQQQVANTLNLEQNMPPTQPQLAQLQQIISQTQQNPNFIFDPTQVLLAAQAQQPSQPHLPSDIFSAPPPGWPSLPLPPAFPVNLTLPPPPLPVGDTGNQGQGQSWMQPVATQPPPLSQPPPPPPQPAASTSTSAKPPPASSGGATAGPTPQSILQSLAALGAIINKKQAPPPSSGRKSGEKGPSKSAASADHHPPPPPPPPPKAAAPAAKSHKEPEEDTVLSTSNSSDDVPASAVDLQNKQAKKAGKQMLIEIEERVKKIVKPSYVGGKLDKEGYKEVMKKCVTKIFAKKPKHINEEKIKEFVEAYLARALAECASRKKHQHQHHPHNRPDSGTSSSADAPVQHKKTTSSTTQQPPPPLS